MAKKKDAEKSNSEGFGAKLATFIIILFIVIIWLGILALLVKFDAGGLGTRFRPYLEDVPVLNRILPDLTDEELAQKNNYSYKNLDEAIQAINELTELVDKYKEENSDYASRQAEMQQTIDNLQQYADDYESYLEQRKEFDDEIVYNSKAPEASDYIKWYESMNPENAAKIYEQLKGEETKSAAIESVADYFTKMNAKDAAKILEEYTSDLDLVCDILDCLKRTTVTDILTQMEKDDALFAARVVDRMAKRSRASGD